MWPCRHKCQHFCACHNVFKREWDRQRQTDGVRGMHQRSVCAQTWACVCVCARACVCVCVWQVFCWNGAKLEVLSQPKPYSWCTDAQTGTNSDVFRGQLIVCFNHQVCRVFSNLRAGRLSQDRVFGVGIFRMKVYNTLQKQNYIYIYSIHHILILKDE